MRYAIIEKNDELSRKGKQKIIKAFTEANFIYDETHPQLVISIGGDGTLLEAFRLYQGQLDSVRFVGIHSGNLGFYTDWLITEIDQFIMTVLTQQPVFETYPLLQTQIIYPNKTDTFLALNEVTITDYHRTLAMDVYIDNIYFESFRGTGLCISTPSGSTAYNKSLGGTLVHPSIRTFQLTEMASINNTVYRTLGSSMIFSQGEKVSLHFQQYQNSIVCTNDHATLTVNEMGIPQEIILTIADCSITFARYKKINFWQRVHRSFIAQ